MTEPSEPVLPDRAMDEQDTAWGDPTGSDDEDVRRLRDERPPHHEDRD
jgi:hypothetical protein